ncbi:unnamed protein product [Parnassius mnemosyne]|uniref:SCP domain-containing protein n=1 Tax=Parnassius mnemosyne TaxID=213953 RepID=A0AAV1LT93_9NEOP
MLAFFVKNLYLLCIIFIILFTSYYCEAKNYCNSNICDNQHTLCKFKLNEPAQRCVDHEKTIKTKKDKQEILDKINSRRNRVASGDIRSLPAAENMLKMEWNDELEISAQRWADQCMPYKQLDIKDFCRDLDNVHVGQNIATVVGESTSLTPAILVDVWYMELLNVNASIISRYRPSNQSHLKHYDYFTQLVWAESNLVGCGGVKFRERFDNGKQNRTINRLICNFAPGGNQFMRSVYIEGVACSHCPFGGVCDPTYTCLCNFKQPLIKQLEINDNEKGLNNHIQNVILSVSTGENYKSNATNNNTRNIESKILTTFSLDNEDESTTTFDYFAQVLNTVYSTETISTGTIITCKDIMPVEDFIEVFKKRLLKDQVLKEFFLTSKMSENKENSDGAYTDASVADFMGQIYSKKESPTTLKATESAYLNSTLLVDLVEAVIFRNNDKISATEKVEQNSKFQSHSDVNAIKIKAELGQVKENLHFTGHYFFPEDDNDQDVKETTELYYDISSMAVSDIELEIENLKRNKGTKDFLEEILESDYNTENLSKIEVLSLNTTHYSETGSEYNLYGNLKTSPTKTSVLLSPFLRKKRCHKNVIIKRNKGISHNDIESKDFKLRINETAIHYIDYKHLLKKIVADLKILTLKEQFHCTDFAILNSSSLCSISNLFLTLLFLFCLLLNFN